MLEYFHFIILETNLPICGFEELKLCAGGKFCAEVLCVESFPLSEMGHKLPISGIDDGEVCAGR